MAVSRAEGRLARAAQFFCLLAFALLIRSPAFGEWNYGIDDQFYALVGDRIRAGDLLYVDIWDRKGPLLYLIFAGIGAVWPSMVAFQLAATFSAALGAYGINRIARQLDAPKGAIFAGLAYLALLSRFEGANLEAGVFINTLTVATAFVLISRYRLLREGRIDAALLRAFLCTGLAIAIKQSAAAEGLAFGFVALALLARSGRPLAALAWRAVILALAGATPMIVTGLFYWANGHFAELWNAMATSNLARGYADPAIRMRRIVTMAGMLALPLAFAGIGFHALMLRGKEGIGFVVFWAGSTLALLFSFPNIFVHYAQPALPPLAVLSAGYFTYRKPIWPGVMALIPLSLALSGSFHLPDRLHARAASRALLNYVRKVTPEHKLLVWGAPSYLYTLADARPASPLAFTPHLYEAREWSGFDQMEEVSRILATRPETVVVQVPLPSSPLNSDTVRIIDAYTRNCLRSAKFTVYDHDGPQVQVVFSACRH